MLKLRAYMPDEYAYDKAARTYRTRGGLALKYAPRDMRDARRTASFVNGRTGAVLFEVQDANGKRLAYITPPKVNV